MSSERKLRNPLVRLAQFWILDVLQTTYFTYYCSLDSD